MRSREGGAGALRWISTGWIPLLALIVGCTGSTIPTGLGGGGGGGGGGGSGAVLITVTTAGSNFDANGYQLVFNELTSEPVGVNAEVTLSNLAVGAYQVTLADVATNCVIQGSSGTKPFSVSAGATTNVDFEVSCS
jgi:hypothetical protein